MHTPRTGYLNVSVMNIFNRRDTILKAMYDLGGKNITSDALAEKAGINDLDTLDSDLDWMEGMGVVKNVHSFSGGTFITSLTTTGQNCVELKKSLKTLAEESIREAIMNQQNNYNSGNAVNNMGDHNVTNFHVNEGAIDDFLKALRENGNEDLALKLEDIAATEGKQSAVLELTKWVGRTWLTPAALTAVQAVGVAHGLF